MHNKFEMDCVLLHGWGMRDSIWNDFSKRLNGFNNTITPCLYELADEKKDSHLDSIANALDNRLENDCVVVAWSMGGLIATRLALLSEKVKAVINISSPYCFFNKPGWNNVLDRKSIIDLKKRLLKNATSTLLHFSGLVAHGDNELKKTTKIIRSNIADIKNKKTLSLWLDELLIDDQREQCSMIKAPTLHLFGENDALINHQIQNQINTLRSNIKSHVVSDCGHAPFIGQAKITANLINEFINAEFR